MVDCRSDVRSLAKRFLFGFELLAVLRDRLANPVAWVEEASQPAASQLTGLLWTLHSTSADCGLILGLRSAVAMRRKLDSDLESAERPAVEILHILMTRTPTSSLVIKSTSYTLRRDIRDGTTHCNPSGAPIRHG